MKKSQFSLLSKFLSQLSFQNKRRDNFSMSKKTNLLENSLQSISSLVNWQRKMLNNSEFLIIWTFLSCIQKISIPDWQLIKDIPRSPMLKMFLLMLFHVKKTFKKINQRLSISWLSLFRSLTEGTESEANFSRKLLRQRVETLRSWHCT